jgi:ATP-dependent Clp protease ATP-binding subunit ClpC
VKDGRFEVFERFTDGARQAVVLGQQEAYAVGADAVGTEHLLVGLLDQGDELVAEALTGAGFPERAPQSPPYPPPVRTVHIPLTPEAAKALRRSEDESAALGEAHVRPGHLLLALLRSDDAFSPRGGGAIKLLQEQEIDVLRLQDRVIRLLESGGGARRP